MKPGIRQLLDRFFSITPPEHEAPGPAPGPRSYAAYWDRYVEHFSPQVSATDQTSARRHAWPGDEWGDQALWDRIFDTLIRQHVPADARSFVEIGAGSGKYTLLVLQHYKQATVRCYDVSRAYLDVLRRRCRDHVESGRIVPEAMSGDPRFMLEHLRGQGQVELVDCLYSIDAMVHVDLQYLMAYLLTAAAVLRPGGKLILSLADATSEGGFAKLLGDIASYFPLQGQMSSKFEWLSPDLVRSVLGRLGFVVDGMYDLNGRDMWLCATLKERPSLPW